MLVFQGAEFGFAYQNSLMELEIQKNPFWL